MYRLVYTKQAQKDAKKLRKTTLVTRARKLLMILARDPFESPPSYEKLLGDMHGAYSRRINEQHRLVYQVYEELRVVKILRLRTRYE